MINHNNLFCAFKQIVPISATTGHRTEKLFASVDRSAVQFSRRISTAVLNVCCTLLFLFYCFYSLLVIQTGLVLEKSPACIACFHNLVSRVVRVVVFAGDSQ